MNFLEFLYMALATPYGIVVSVSDAKLARAKLYHARAQAQDPDLAILQLRPDPSDPDNLLWIIKGEPKNASA